MDVHGEIGSLAERFLSGTLSEEEDAEVAAHAEECPECAEPLQAAQTRARAPEPFWTSPGFVRALKGAATLAVLVALILLGSLFQDRANAETPSPSEEACTVMPPRRPRPSQRSEADPDSPRDSVLGGGRVFKAAGGSAGAGVPPTRVDPFEADAKLIRHAELELEADSFPTAQARVTAIVAEEKGFLSGADTHRLPNGKMSGVLTLRVPPDRFEAVLERLRELGVVRHQNVQTRDVTKTYVDLEARLASKNVLVERLKKVLAEAQGTVKELMDVEVQIGKTVEEIEAIKGELKYLDNVTGFSTIVLRLSERDLGQPIEVVETLDASLGLAVREPESAYTQAQKIVTDAGGQVTDAQLNREGSGTVQAVVRARVEAAKFPGIRDALRAMGQVTKDVVNRRRAAQGQTPRTGQVPVRSELAALELSLASLVPQVTRRVEVTIETADVDAAYQAARRAFEEAGAAVTGGGLSAATGESTATLGGEMDIDRSATLLPRLSSLGKVRRSDTRHTVPKEGSAPGLERARVDLTIATPSPLVPEERGLTGTMRTTFSGSVAGLLWSVERLFVGLSLAVPWAAIAVVAWLVWRRIRKRKAEPQPAAQP